MRGKPVALAPVHFASPFIYNIRARTFIRPLFFPEKPLISLTITNTIL